MKHTVCLLLLFVCGCSQWLTKPKPETLLESEYFPVQVMVKINGKNVPFDRLSMLDIIDMNDWSQVTITPVRKKDVIYDDGNPKGATHYLVTPRGVDKLRPKSE